MMGRYMLKFDGETFARTDRLPLVAGWLAGADTRVSVCDTLECFDTPCAYCLDAGEVPDLEDEPLVPTHAYVGEVRDFELAMRTNGSWDAPDTYDPHEYGTYADPGPCTWDPDLVRVIHDPLECPLLAGRCSQ